MRKKKALILLFVITTCLEKNFHKQLHYLTPNDPIVTILDELCGCGIGFKLIQALSESWDKPEENLFPYLDLVATAIAADIVPMEGENRTLASLVWCNCANIHDQGFKAC